jgi:HrpA-like RNA helicase
MASPPAASSKRCGPAAPIASIPYSRMRSHQEVIGTTGTGKTTLVVLFNTVRTGHNVPSNDPRRMLAVPPATRVYTQRNDAGHGLSG